MGLNLKFASFIVVVLISVVPLHCYAENWVQFHHEKWSQKSGQQNKKLNFSNRYYYDAENLVRTASGDISLWIKVVSDNDSYYVKKGSPRSETLFKQAHLWCKHKKYEIVHDDGGDTGLNESMGEEIKPGSYYEKLYNAVCEQQGSR